MVDLLRDNGCNKGRVLENQNMRIPTTLVLPKLWEFADAVLHYFLIAKKGSSWLG